MLDRRRGHAVADRRGKTLEAFGTILADPADVAVTRATPNTTGRAQPLPLANAVNASPVISLTSRVPLTDVEPMRS